MKAGIGARLREGRKLLSMTLREFAEPLEISSSYLSDVETGKKSPSETLVSFICTYYGFDKRWLKSGEGEMFGKEEGAVREEPRGYAIGLDVELLAEAVRKTEETLQALNRELTPEKKAKVIVGLYEIAGQQDRKIDPTAVRAMLRLIE